MKTYSDVLGNETTAAEMLSQFEQDATETGETLPKWIERQSRELWGSEHNPNDDWKAIADDLKRSAND